MGFSVIDNRPKTVAQIADLRSESGRPGLVIVPTKAMALNFAKPTRSRSWELGDGYSPGDQLNFLRHMFAGASTAKFNQNSLLIFSGGFTSETAEGRSESRAYYDVASHSGMLDGIKDRVRLEEGAVTSFQSFLFSIARFREEAGTYPAKIAVIGFSTEYELFTSHTEALRKPGEQRVFLGFGTPMDVGGEVAKTEVLINEFKADPYGSKEVLKKLRSKRDPFGKSSKYAERYQKDCPEIAELLRHEGPEIYSGDLPWG
jgi:hypothetical protein